MYLSVPLKYIQYIHKLNKWMNTLQRTGLLWAVMSHYTMLLFASLSCEDAGLNKRNLLFFILNISYKKKYFIVFHVALKCKMSDWTFKVIFVLLHTWIVSAVAGSDIWKAVERGSEGKTYRSKSVCWQGMQRRNVTPGVNDQYFAASNRLRKCVAHYARGIWIIL